MFKPESLPADQQVNWSEEKGGGGRARRSWQLEGCTQIRRYGGLLVSAAQFSLLQVHTDTCLAYVMTSHAVGHPFLAAAATCEKCGYHQAYFNEIQIRSADEPATLFFQVCEMRKSMERGLSKIVTRAVWKNLQWWKPDVPEASILLGICLVFWLSETAVEIAALLTSLPHSIQTQLQSNLSHRLYKRIDAACGRQAVTVVVIRSTDVPSAVLLFKYG